MLASAVLWLWLQRAIVIIILLLFGAAICLVALLSLGRLEDRLGRKVSADIGPRRDVR